jgi:hypothetical protein
MPAPPHSYQATLEQIQADIDRYVDSFIGGLQSFFELMPKGAGFIHFERFQAAYGVLREETDNFGRLELERVLAAIRRDSLALVVLRSILGVTPPELASLVRERTGMDLDQSAARRLDKRAREGNDLLGHAQPKTRQQVRGLVQVAVELLRSGAPDVPEGVMHRLDKIDTATGIEGIRQLAAEGVPYEVLLYERFLGRPFAGHRDSVSEHVGETLQGAVRSVLASFSIPYHECGVAERFEDMDQAPDFLVPGAADLLAVIEAKLAEDDGTARDKVTRIQHLGELRDQRERRGESSYEVIACVDGRGFGIRREDVKKLLFATRGKLFNASTVGQIVAHTSLAALAGPSEGL